jgi:hypothetical protein
MADLNFHIFGIISNQIFQLKGRDNMEIDQ